MRTRIAALGTTLLLATLSTTAVAQKARATAHATVLAPVVVVGEGDAPIDDALLDGVALTDAQQRDIAGLRQLQDAEQVASREPMDAALDVLRRARARGDEDTAHAILLMLQTQMQSQRTWRLAAVRALLTTDQRRRFDANVNRLLGDDAP